MPKYFSSQSNGEDGWFTSWTWGRRDTFVEGATQKHKQHWDRYASNVTLFNHWIFTQDYSNPTAHNIESLVKLEAEYGPLPQYYPAIDNVLDYLKEVYLSI